MSRELTDKSMTLTCTERKQAAMKYITGPITVRGQTHAPQEIVAVYQAPLDARAEPQGGSPPGEGRPGRTHCGGRRDGTQDEFVQSWVDATFGPESQQAVDFGYAPKRTAKVTATEKVQAAAKA